MCLSTRYRSSCRPSLLKSSPRFCFSLEGQTEALCGSWGYKAIHLVGSYIIIKHLWGVSQQSFDVDVHMCLSLQCYCCFAVYIVQTVDRLTVDRLHLEVSFRWRYREWMFPLPLSFPVFFTPLFRKWRIGDRAKQEKWDFTCITNSVLQPDRH